METLTAALQLLAQIFGATKAYLELKGSRQERGNHVTPSTDGRPKHLRE